MARDIKDYEQENPNARQQADEWKKQRAARGRTPTTPRPTASTSRPSGRPTPAPAGSRTRRAPRSGRPRASKDQVAGTLKAGAGKVLRNEGLAAEGEAQKQAGQASRKAD